MDVNELNKFFIGDSNPNPIRDHRLIDTVPLDDQFYFSHVPAEEVVEAILSARSIAKGPDDIPVKFLEDCLPTILPVLLHIFDCSLQSGVFPSAWKTAIVRPLPKSWPPAEAGDFRHISILCAGSKILEIVAYKQISSYIFVKSLLDPLQSDFRKGHSTYTALIKIVDDIREGIEDGQIVLLVAIDFSRAFDLVNVYLLIDKLRALDFSVTACRWFFSFLTIRSQVLQGPSGERSEPIVRNCGVPQGTINGPPFFSLFANDAPSVLKHCRHHMYADDLTIYCQGSPKDINGIVEKINADLQNLTTWARSNGLAINARKTHVIWFRVRTFMATLYAGNPPNVFIDNQPVEVGREIKLLGCTLDSTLTFTQHCATTCRKAFTALSKLRKCAHCLPKNTKLLLVFY